MNTVDIVAVEHHGDDLVITARGAASRWQIGASGILVIALILFALLGCLLWRVVSPVAIALNVVATGWFVWWFASALRWSIDGSEEWRLDENVLTYGRWSGETLKTRREFPLERIERIGMRRRQPRVPSYEFAVVVASSGDAATGGDCVGAASYSPETARAVNAALRERLDARFAARVFDS